MERNFDTQYFMGTHNIDDNMIIGRNAFSDFDTGQCVRALQQDGAQLIKIDDVCPYSVEWFHAKRQENMEIITGVRIVLV
jgi:hypothetical protein